MIAHRESHESSFSCSLSISLSLSGFTCNRSQSWKRSGFSLIRASIVLTSSSNVALGSSIAGYRAPDPCGSGMRIPVNTSLGGPIRRFLAGPAILLGAVLTYAQITGLPIPPLALAYAAYLFAPVSLLLLCRDSSSRSAPLWGIAAVSLFWLPIEFDLLPSLPVPPLPSPRYFETSAPGKLSAAQRSPLLHSVSISFFNNGNQAVSFLPMASPVYSILVIAPVPSGLGCALGLG